MDEATDRQTQAKRLARAVLFSRYGWVGAAVVSAVAAGLVYLFSEGITAAFSASGDGVRTALGLGIVPVAVWLAALAWTIGYRRAWLKRFNLWLGSLAFVAVTLGILDFFAARDGILGFFTVGGDVALGGNLGSAIVGELAWLGPLRVLALAAVALGFVFPRLALDLAVVLGKAAVVAYIFSMVAIKGLGSGLARMYRFDRDSEGVKGGLTVTRPEPGAEAWVMRTDSSTSVARKRDASGDEAALPSGATSPTPALQSATGTLAALPESVRAGPQAADIEPDEAESEEPLFESQSTDEEVPEEVGVNRYNKFWAPDDSDEDRNGVAAGQLPKDEGAAEDGAATAGPILDAMAASWDRPPLKLLVDAPQDGISQDEIADTSETVSRTLADYSVEVEVGEIKPGPTVTMYGLVPGWVRRYKQVKVTDEQGKPKMDESGKPVVTKVETKTRVKVDSILSREKDLALALGTPSIRIETPVMGKSLVGIEVPNPTPTLITLRSVMESAAYKRLRSTAKLPFALGKGSGGETKVIDLAKLPHLLVAGATGSGKSVFINTIVSSLLMERTPAEMRLLLVDPKRVELTPYNGIPHLLTPVVVETDQVVSLLKGMIREMLSRYRVFEEMGVKNIDTYNKKASETMPYLVIAVDELADLMMSASFDVEQSLCRLAQLGRATGIHLIVATQRPSVDVVTGLIKANFPSRVSFAVTSQIDSRTIMDTVGAEKLLGRGDMLYQAVDATRPERVQGVFVSDQEIEDVVNFWQTTPWAPLPKVSLHTVGDGDAEDADAENGEDGGLRDEMLDKAIELAHTHNKLSTSLLQRRMRIGYPRAARLMDELEEQGVVGPSDGSKSRDVIISST